MTKKIEIPAIHDKEFLSILEKLGLLSEIQEKKAVCFNCQEPLTIENVGGIKIVDNKPKLICDNPECLTNE